MSLLLLLIGGGALNFVIGMLIRLLGGSRQLACRVCSILAGVATGLPVVMFACAFISSSGDQDARASMMLAVSSLTLVVASLSCWIPVWALSRRPKQTMEAGPGLSPESQQKG